MEQVCFILKIKQNKTASLWIDGDDLKHWGHIFKEETIPIMRIESELLPGLSSKCNKGKMPPPSDLPTFTTASGPGHTDPRFPAQGVLWYLAESKKDSWEDM